MADVFISYAREDREKAEHIARGLGAMGLDVFWDTDIPPGQTWADYIETKLTACNVVIVLWSEHSTKSQWVREEARIGRDKSKLIPVMLDHSTPPFGFGEVQAADLSAWNGDFAAPDWHRVAHAVHLAARGPITYAAPPPQPATQPAPAFVAPAATAWRGSAATSEQLSPIAYVQKCLRMYIDGRGRARRSEYWWWALFAVLALVLAGLIDMQSGVDATGTPVNPIFTGAVWLGLLAPGISVTARRLHDINLSGWLAAAIVGVTILGMALSAQVGPLGPALSLLAVVAAVGVGLIPSVAGPNQYGPSPKPA